MRSETLEEGMMHEIEYTEQRGGAPKQHRSHRHHQHDNEHERHQERQISKYEPSAVQTRDQEWTTTKRIVNHKTRQVETRVQRQLVMEDGKVIADSGPQVITRVREDCRNEESQNDNRPPPLAPPEGWKPVENEVGKVMGEKKEVSVVSREIKEENMQYHDERIKELTGKDVHRRALTAPNELITINDKKHPDYYYRQHKGSGSDDSDAENKNGKIERTDRAKGQLFSRPPRGKMVHYSAKGKKFQDTDEIHTLSKLAADGSITKEVKHVRHHEEFSDDEEPDRDGTAPREPVATKQTRQHVEYLHDYTSSSDSESNEEHSIQRSPRTERKHRHEKKTKKEKSHKNKTFPHYTIETGPVGRQSTLSEDYKNDSSKNWVRHTFEKTDRGHDSDNDNVHISKSRQSQLSSETPTKFVPVPDEYKVNRETIEKSKRSRSNQHQRHHKDKSPSPERSYSPAKSHRSHASHKGSQRSLAHKEDASVQATLSDEERSIKSDHSHRKSTKSLQRQSTSKSQRSYYFGEPEPTSQDESMDERRHRMSQSPNKPHGHRLSPVKSERKHEMQSELGLRPVSRQSGTHSPTKSDQIYSISRNRPSSKNSYVKTKTSTVSASLDHEERPKSPSGKHSTKASDGKANVLFSSRSSENRDNVRSKDCKSDARTERPVRVTSVWSQSTDGLRDKLENIVGQHSTITSDPAVVSTRDYRSRQRAASPCEPFRADSLLERLNKSSLSIDSEREKSVPLQEQKEIDMAEVQSTSSNKTYDVSDPIIGDVDKWSSITEQRTNPPAISHHVIATPMIVVDDNNKPVSGYIAPKLLPDISDDIEYKISPPMTTKVHNITSPPLNEQNGTMMNQVVTSNNALKEKNIDENKSDNEPNVAKGGQSYFFDLHDNKPRKQPPKSDLYFAHSLPSRPAKPEEYFPVYHTTNSESRKPLASILASINNSADRIKREAAARNHVPASSLMSQNKRSRSRTDISPSWPTPKSTKYSIYGGKKKSEFDLPVRVPRLSYSKSIGPDNKSEPVNRNARFLRMK